MNIYCCECQQTVNADNVSGASLFPQSKNKKVLAANFWVCPTCNCHVGCKKGSKNPKGVIQSKAIKKALQDTHRVIDAMTEIGFKYGNCTGQITKRLGHQYRSTDISSVQDAEIALVAVVMYLNESGEKNLEKVTETLSKKRQKVSALRKADPTITIWCTCCNKMMPSVLREAKLVTPKSKPASMLWVCTGCLNYISCHQHSGGLIKPMGCIANPELRAARKHIHAKLDAIWRLGFMTRNDIYASLSNSIGREYHTAEIKTVPEARNIYRLLNAMTDSMTANQQQKIQEEIEKASKS